jgi:hypothetical protein
VVVLIMVIIYGRYNTIRIFDTRHLFGDYMDFTNRLKDSLWWWLSKRKPFVINNEYELELLYIDKINNSVKVRITNLKNKDGNIESAVLQSEGNHDR